MGLHLLCISIYNIAVGASGKDGAVVRAIPSHQCDIGTNPCTYQCYMWLSFLLILSLDLRSFSPGSPRKSTFQIPIQPGIR